MGIDGCVQGANVRFQVTRDPCIFFEVPERHSLIWGAALGLEKMSGGARKRAPLFLHTISFEAVLFNKLDFIKFSVIAWLYFSFLL